MRSAIHSPYRSAFRSATPGASSSSPALSGLPLLDNFSDPNGTTLQSHESDSEHNWSHQAGPVNQEIQDNRVFGLLDFSGEVTSYVSTAQAAGSDVRIIADFHFVTVDAGDVFGVEFRRLSFTNFYSIEFNQFSGAWELFGPGGVAETSAEQVYSAGQTVRMQLDAVGSSLVVTVDDVELFNVSTALFDPDTPAGLGLRSSFSEGQAAGVHCEFLQVDNL